MTKIGRQFFREKLVAAPGDTNLTEATDKTLVNVA